jgi:alkanesulfonate monooxygenase SsuD/methylene tetrahydromethanopterin reductase-like flavin-dependent oxidoreductase (luciferase family)
MVGANTFRKPGLTAKLATTLDHVSGGRAVLGIGGAWFDREHDAFGLPDWSPIVGERLDRLDESVMVLRRLLDGERFTHMGRFYTLTDALCEPRPIQAHLPILIGGSGPRKTLRTTALRADAWNTSGTADEVRVKVETLETISFPIVIRDTAEEAERVYAASLAANGADTVGEVPLLLGSPTLIADGLRPFVALGFRTVIVRLPWPFDRETIDRMSEVGEQLADA